MVLDTYICIMSRRWDRPVAFVCKIKTFCYTYVNLLFRGEDMTNASHVRLFHNTDAFIVWWVIMMPRT